MRWFIFFQIFLVFCIVMHWHAPLACIAPSRNFNPFRSCKSTTGLWAAIDVRLRIYQQQFWLHLTTFLWNGMLRQVPACVRR